MSPPGQTTRPCSGNAGTRFSVENAHYTRRARRRNRSRPSCRRAGPARGGGLPASGFAGGLEQGGAARLARAGAGPQDELDRLVVALAGVDGGVARNLALPPRGFDSARQDEGMAEHHHAVLAPPVEMAEPQLL